MKNLINIKELILAIETSTIVTITDIYGTITYVNENFEKISQYSSDELVGNNHKIVNSEYHDKDFWKDFWQTIKNGGIWRGEIKNKRKDNSYYWVDNVVTPIRDDNDRIIGFLSIRFDITKKKELEQRLDLLNHELYQYIFFISHNLNATLARLKGLLHLFMHIKDKQNKEELFQHLLKTTQEIDDIVVIINKMVEDNIQLINSSTDEAK